MPNPLVRLGQTIQSKKPPQRPEPDPPVLEHYAGHNNPWRGTEEHGVTPNNEPSAPGTDLNTREGIHYAPLPPAMDPIPVYMVQVSGRELRRWRPLRISVDNTRPVQLAGRNEDRSSILVRNDSAESVWIDFDNRVNQMTSMELVTGASVTLSTEDAVWVIGGTANMLNKIQAAEFYSVQEP